MISVADIIIFSILGCVIGVFVERTFHYRKLWLQSKNRVSWIMPSNDPNKWAIEKTFYYSDSDAATYSIVDKDTKAHVANDFKTVEDARMYIMHRLDQFQSE